jgi:hypothetical protein
MGNGRGKFIFKKGVEVVLTRRRNIIYTSLFNMIDYPAMVIPLHSEVSVELDPIDKDFKAANPRDAEVQAQCKSTYTMQEF